MIILVSKTFDKTPMWLSDEDHSDQPCINMVSTSSVVTEHLVFQLSIY